MQRGKNGTELEPNNSVLQTFTWKPQERCLEKRMDLTFVRGHTFCFFTTTAYKKYQYFYLLTYLLAYLFMQIINTRNW